MKLKKLAAVAIASVGAAGMVIVGVFVGTAFAGEPSKPSLLDTNDQGLTFGSAMGVPREQTPDLILVIGDGGHEGYVYDSELHPPAPSSPEEALATQLRPGDAAPVLDVYLSDGKTKIDTFTIDIPTFEDAG